MSGLRSLASTAPPSRTASVMPTPARTLSNAKKRRLRPAPIEITTSARKEKTAQTEEPEPKRQKTAGGFAQFFEKHSIEQHPLLTAHEREFTRDAQIAQLARSAPLREPSADAQNEIDSSNFILPASYELLRRKFAAMMQAFALQRARSGRRMSRRSSSISSESEQRSVGSTVWQGMAGRARLSFTELKRASERICRSRLERYDVSHVVALLPPLLEVEDVGAELRVAVAADNALPENLRDDTRRRRALHAAMLEHLHECHEPYHRRWQQRETPAAKIEKYDRNNVFGWCPEFLDLVVDDKVPLPRAPLGHVRLQQMRAQSHVLESLKTADAGVVKHSRRLAKQLSRIVGDEDSHVPEHIRNIASQARSNLPTARAALTIGSQSMPPLVYNSEGDSSEHVSSDASSTDRKSDRGSDHNGHWVTDDAGVTVYTDGRYRGLETTLVRQVQQRGAVSALVKIDAARTSRALGQLEKLPSLASVVEGVLAPRRTRSMERAQLEGTCHTQWRLAHHKHEVAEGLDALRQHVPQWASQREVGPSSRRKRIFKISRLPFGEVQQALDEMLRQRMRRVLDESVDNLEPPPDETEHAEETPTADSAR